ncbi:hypothetical protein PanWU01x14_106540 [Parasponia andersonii]|uniref:Uncharacterized protein n=1 Tax=Parasponia andersonii TaxID=3476 RepID=A0A2P5D0P5_PARAD|nr:hypothetical protein PanWU01x14_106540 [Parasponia andersonii]
MRKSSSSFKSSISFSSLFILRSDMENQILSLPPTSDEKFLLKECKKKARQVCNEKSKIGRKIKRLLGPSCYQQKLRQGTKEY